MQDSKREKGRKNRESLERCRTVRERSVHVFEDLPSTPANYDIYNQEVLNITSHLKEKNPVQIKTKKLTL